MNKTYKDILSEEIKKEENTDYGVLNAYWATTRRLIEIRASKKECLQFLQDFGRAFGEFKMVEAKGDFIDANLL